MDTTILKRANELAPKLVEIRRSIHRYPELGFTEHRTASLVADTLGSLGLAVETGIGKTGVVGHMGSEGPILALRADMDALPIQEQNQTEYTSLTPDVMHACGHDVHTACLLGAAMLLKDSDIKGRVRFLFQPSEEGMDEEGKSGAMRMVAEGAIDGVQAIFGLHVDSKFEAGTIACSPGYILAALDNFKIKLFGRAAHAAQAHLGADTILLAAQVINSLHTIVSRRIPPLENAVLSIGMIEGGVKENVLAEEVTLRGTIRTFDPEMRTRLIQEMHAACSLVRALGGDYQLTLQEGYLALKNDPVLATFSRQVACELVGAQAVKDSVVEMGSEDFSFFTQRAVGCYLILGVGAPGQPVRPMHHPAFDVDESALPLGAALLAQLAIRYFERKPLDLP